MAIMKPFRVKDIDMAYCMRCRWGMYNNHLPFDFCRYDGMPCVQNCEYDFVFTCKHFDPIPYHVLDRILITL